MTNGERPLTRERWERIRVLFEAAIDRAPPDRSAWIARETADDPPLGAEVLSLLQNHARAGAFLSEPVGNRLPELLGDDEPLAPDARVGPYTIVRELGRGGMGRVYLASDTRLGRTVALKALAPRLLRDPSQRERLRREARAAASLTHPGICTVYALEEFDGDLYIATEFVDGQTLGDEIRSGRHPSPDEVLRMAREVAAALASAHAAGIVHRDLKPDNVMRARDGRLKILDFGLARAIERSGADQRVAAAATQPGVLIGTPAYMAPEQINGQPADARADVFALGVLLYEYATGVHPFAGATLLATAARVLESDARPIVSRYPQIAPALADAISRCLRKVPGDRFATGGELLAALDAAQAGDAGSATRGPHLVWWRTHQLAIVALYVIAGTLAWQIKEWIETTLTVAVFLALGAAATIGGIFRGHLVFTERMNRSHLSVELGRACRATMLVDLLFAALLLVDGVMVAKFFRPLPAVFTISLALSIALARLILEPATTAATFGDR